VLLIFAKSGVDPLNIYEGTSYETLSCLYPSVERERQPNCNMSFCLFLLFPSV